MLFDFIFFVPFFVRGIILVELYEVDWTVENSADQTEELWIIVNRVKSHVEHVGLCGRCLQDLR